jgi:hypothetical protein
MTNKELMEEIQNLRFIIDNFRHPEPPKYEVFQPFSWTSAWNMMRHTIKEIHKEWGVVKIILTK